MKKIIMIILVGLFISTIACSAKENTVTDTISKADKEQYSEITKDFQIIEILEIMKNSPAKFAYEKILGNNQSKKPIKLIFKDLSALNPQYKNYDAVGWKRGIQLYIYINPKNTKASKEALCALIAGRALHDDETDSINENVECIMIEAMTWDYFVDKNPALENEQSDLVVKRENILRKYFILGNKTDKYIRIIVKKNPIYQGLPETSPGFED